MRSKHRKVDKTQSVKKEGVWGSLHCDVCSQTLTLIKGEDVKRLYMALEALQIPFLPEDEYTVYLPREKDFDFVLSILPSSSSRLKGVKKMCSKRKESQTPSPLPSPLPEKKTVFIPVRGRDRVVPSPPRTVYRDRVVPRTVYRDRVVPRIVYRDREVPRIEYRDFPMERFLESLSEAASYHGGGYLA